VWEGALVKWGVKVSEVKSGTEALIFKILKHWVPYVA
jgi:hypothetical protein